MLWLFAAGLLAAAPAERPKLVVLPVAIDRTARVQAPEQLDELVLTAVQATGKYEVIGASDINALLDFEKRKDALGCDDTTCFAELGGALGAQKLVAMQVGLISGTWLVTSKVVDASALAVEARSSEFIEGSELALLKAVPNLIGRLFGGGGNANVASYQCSASRPDECEAQCNAGHAGSCAVLGWLVEKGIGVGQNPVRAEALYVRACDAGEMRGCAALGVLYMFIRAHDDPKAAAVLDRACAGGIGNSCFNLARLHIAGQGVPANFSEGKRLLERGCQLDHGPACSYLASWSSAGDPKHRIQLWLRGCELGRNATACDKLFAELVSPR
ncbi:MAG: sel1 repeat family protein, partial [Deltaproteobacteria bacterium]|nr:sel1 repeat family protein [Deltaproteobacteria bacterium]